MSRVQKNHYVSMTAWWALILNEEIWENVIPVTSLKTERMKGDRDGQNPGRAGQVG